MAVEVRTWESGGLFVVQIEILNDGSTSGNHNVEIRPGAGQEFEFLYGRIFNGDVAARTAVATIRNEQAGTMAELQRSSIGAGDDAPIPSSNNTASLVAGVHFDLGGDMGILYVLASVAVSQNSIHCFVLRLRGEAPTITITSPSGATETTDFAKTEG